MISALREMGYDELATQEPWKNKANLGRSPKLEASIVRQRGARGAWSVVRTKPIWRHGLPGQTKPIGPGAVAPNKANWERPSRRPGAIASNKPNLGTCATGPGPVVQTNPIGSPGATGRDTPLFQYAIIPSFQSVPDRAGQTQFAIFRRTTAWMAWAFLEPAWSLGATPVARGVPHNVLGERGTRPIRCRSGQALRRRAESAPGCRPPFAGRQGSF
jgi:hypothetical protein